MVKKKYKKESIKNLCLKSLCQRVFGFCGASGRGGVDG